MGFLSAPVQRRTTRRPSLYRTGPWIGMRDSLDPMLSSDPLRALAIQNMYPLELDKPSAFVGRPGFDQAGSQLGIAGSRTGQLVYQFTKLDGTEITLAIVGGQGIYTYDWSTETWTQAVTVANLTTASITLSETARCYATTYTDKVLISDGVNEPFTWDGTSGAGGLTELTAADVLYGQPRIHYAKSFGIKSTERNVMEWSEENDPTIGYETTPYSNSWQLGQTDQEGLYALAPTNDALYYLRARSTGAIYGAVTPEFTADGTHEGVSQTIGTTSPDSVCIVGERVFFLSADAQPHVIDGGRVKPLFDDIRETIRGLDRTASSLAAAITRYDALTGLVLFGVAETGQANPSAILVFNPVLDVPVAVWRGFTFTTFGIVKNAAGVPVLMHLSSDGYAYDHGVKEGTLWDDELNAGTAAIRHEIETCHLGADQRTEKRFSRVDVLLRADADGSDISLSHATPYGTSVSPVAASVSGGGARWDEPDWDDFTWGFDTVERHAPFGVRAMGRWARFRLSHETAGEQFGVASVAVEYSEAGDRAGAA